MPTSPIQRTSIVAFAAVFGVVLGVDARTVAKRKAPRAREDTAAFLTNLRGRAGIAAPSAVLGVGLKVGAAV